MADKEEGIGKMPEALAKRRREVTLSDGSTIFVEKWSNEKFAALLPFQASMDKIPMIAEQSVAEADREKVRALDLGDQMAITNAAFELNITESVLKNFPAFMKNQARFVEATKRIVPPQSQP